MAIKAIKHQDKIINLSYCIINNNADQNLLILHGWGANKEIMQKLFAKKFKNFNHIYLDLMGFGNSSILPSSPSAGSYEYASVIEKFIKEMQINNKAGIDAVIGHSFGGKIALLLNVRNKVYLSSAGLVGPKRKVVRLKILLAKLIKKNMILKKFARLFSLVSSDMDNLDMALYGTFKRVVDEDMSEVYKSYAKNSNNLVCWGEDDEALSLEIGQKTAYLLGEKLKIYEGNHYFFLNALVIDDIEESFAKIYDQKMIQKSNSKTAHIVVNGRVQGVGFRAFTQRLALEFGGTGFVRNLPECGVEILINVENLPLFIEKLRVGPMMSQVENIEILEIDAVNYDGFVVRK